MSVMAATRRARHLGAAGLQTDTVDSTCSPHLDTCEKPLRSPFQECKLAGTSPSPSIRRDTGRGWTAVSLSRQVRKHQLDGLQSGYLLFRLKHPGWWKGALRRRLWGSGSERAAVKPERDQPLGGSEGPDAPSRSSHRDGAAACPPSSRWRVNKRESDRPNEAPGAGCPGTRHGAQLHPDWAFDKYIPGWWGHADDSVEMTNGVASPAGWMVRVTPAVSLPQHSSLRGILMS